MSNAELARELVQAVSEFDSRMMAFLEEAEAVESADEYRKLQRAIGSVLTETGFGLLYPIYRRHKELIPDTLKGERR